MKNDYYVYLHKNINGIVFYVGKGRQKRSKYSHKRSKSWSIAAKDGYTVEYYKTDLSLEEAEQLEYALIDNPPDEWSLVNVVNFKQDNNLLLVCKNVYYDETSPTFLRWSCDDKPGKRSKNGIAGGINKGYATLMINRKHYLAHRLIWVLFNKQEIPKGYVINHVDCNSENNNISNLELVTSAENNRRKCCHVHQEFTGVFEVKTKPNGTKVYYSAQVVWNENGVQKKKSFGYLKYGKEKAWGLAIEYRKQKIKELNEQGAGYTERHGT